MKSLFEGERAIREMYFVKLTKRYWHFPAKQVQRMSHHDEHREWH